ncbi:hypothetical protein [Streptomyces sp. NPDC046821]|uniref:hypothetical protein n=1 Tax=Streptomyces sp. NPDC046821 TaxID=3154702 RepID=UPI0033D2B291
MAETINANATTAESRESADRSAGPGRHRGGTSSRDDNAAPRGRHRRVQSEQG